ncbi:MAG: hypothetical protein MSD82_12415 [Prevotella sp.]|nr:hypothetical protein [Prevotella sp.]
MSRYLLQKSTPPNGWVLTDTEHGIVVQFENGDFNGTQQVTALDDLNDLSASDLSRVMRELGDWIVRHHASICFGGVHFVEWSEDDSEQFIVRAKQPRFRLHVVGQVTGEELKKQLRLFSNSPFSRISLAPGEIARWEDTPSFFIEAIDGIETHQLRGLVLKAAAYINKNIDRRQ